jgi:hypothetical protein
MGLEPTAFCRASGSWVRSQRRRMAHGQAASGPVIRRSGSSRFAVVCKRFLAVWASLTPAAGGMLELEAEQPERGRLRLSRERGFVGSLDQASVGE